MDTVSSAGWSSIGRTLAFVYAAGWFAGTWIFTLVSFAIIAPQPPDAADRVAHYAYERAVYPQLYVAVVCIAVAMLSLIGLGLVLRHSLGRDGARQQLMAAAFAAAGLFGAIWLFLTIGLLQAVVNVFDPWARDRGEYYSLDWKARAGAEGDEAFANNKK